MLFICLKKKNFYFRLLLGDFKHIYFELWGVLRHLGKLAARSASW